MFETLEYNIQKEREQYKEEGRLEGKLEGHLEGEMKKQIEIAKKMLSNNLSLTIISECTGLSKEEIEKLSI